MAAAQTWSTAPSPSRVASVTQRRSPLPRPEFPTPVQQASSAINLIPFTALQTRVGVVDDLRQSPGVAAVQTGQYGGVSSLFVRGGNSDANKVMIDGIASEDVGGRFDFGTVSSTALDGFELYRGPNSVLYGSDAGASVSQLHHASRRNPSSHPRTTPAMRELPHLAQ